VAGSQVNVSFVRGFMKTGESLHVLFAFQILALFACVFNCVSKYHRIFLGIIEHKGVGFVRLFLF
jgi:hypothetical protein